MEQRRRPPKKKDPLDDALDRGFIWLIIGATSIYSALWLAIRAAKGTLGLWRWFFGRPGGGQARS
jgi:hypothetical protein